jgi:dCMP deaminase
MSRPDWNTYFLKIVADVATRASCVRRQVGCVLVNSRNQILATGYNGKPRGMSNCLKGESELCPGANAHSGTNLDGCFAVHAEANALLQCPDVEKIHTVYVSCVPCIHCMKMLLNTGAQRIVADTDYPGSEQSKKLWQADPNRILIYLRD